MKIPGIVLLCALSLPMAADEGMWLFNQFPKDQVKKTYNFDVTDQFLENLRLATLRIGADSGALVSANGLMLTDIGAVKDCVGKLSTPQHDYTKDGFYAAAQSEEFACPGLEASVVVAMEDVATRSKRPPRTFPRAPLPRSSPPPRRKPCRSVRWPSRVWKRPAPTSPATPAR